MKQSHLIILILAIVFIFTLPRYGYSSNWGYYPSGLLGTVVVVMLILLLLGKL